MEASHQHSTAATSYYGVLGVHSDCSIDEIRRAYRKLAKRWHPDRWTRTPSLSGDAKRKFQQIQEAYSVLSDQRKRTMYDAGLYDPDDEEDEGLCDFVQELVSLMAETKQEDKNCSLEDLQAMFMEMVQGFGSPNSFFCGSSTANFDRSQYGCTKRTRLESYNPRAGRGSAVGMYGNQGFSY